MALNTFKWLPKPEDDESTILVVGTNTRGVMGAGLAKVAFNHWGAVHGKPRGLHGRMYGIVTKNLQAPVHPSIPMSDIMTDISTMYDIAEKLPRKKFLIGYKAGSKTLNGYSIEKMAFMFAPKRIPDNIYFEEGFAKLVEQNQPAN